MSIDSDIENGLTTVEKLNRIKEIRTESLTQAIQEAKTEVWLCVPLQTNLSNLGRKINTRYMSLYDAIENPNNAALFAKKWIWIAARRDQLMWLKYITENIYEDSEENRRYAETFEAGYSDNLAYAFYNCISEYAFNDAIVLQCPGYQGDQLLTAIALVWLCEASALIELSDTEGALDKVADAFTAFKLNNGEWMYEEAGKEADKEARRDLSRRGKLGHAADPRQRAKAYIKDCWIKGREDGTLSGRYKAPFAKKMIADPKCATLQSQKVVEDWCREWEKAHPAG